MKEHLLFKTLKEVTDFSDESFQQLLSLFEARSLAKSELLFTQDTVVKELCFVMKGCLRQYQTTVDGYERNIFFAEEGWWCGEMESFIHSYPSIVSMQALENCMLLSINRERWEYATRNIPDYALYQIKNRSRTVAWLKSMISNIGTETPDEQYRRMLKENAHWVNRLPQYHIASYLGVTPETLSRIRKRNVRL
ncbi:Crp/Fnr family transcriptional regulator [Parapedobacter deserti]|uniref:Crp/Fnr family transcriptional regulator n=1 Tax=Parapedobacter deserti TaxID=1912957 RepID=A0ABV7JKD2_9SPHI